MLDFSVAKRTFLEKYYVVLFMSTLKAPEVYSISPGVNFENSGNATGPSLGTE